MSLYSCFIFSLGNVIHNFMSFLSFLGSCEAISYDKWSVWEAWPWLKRIRIGWDRELMMESVQQKMDMSVTLVGSIWVILEKKSTLERLTKQKSLKSKKWSFLISEVFECEIVINRTEFHYKLLKNFWIWY